MLPELAELDRIRLDEDKTFGQLAAEIGLSAPSTLQRLLKGDGQRAPLDRTLHKIRTYLKRRADARTAPASPERVS